MGQAYNPQEYWQKRLSKRFNLQGVGHMRFSEAYNSWLYRRKQECLAGLFDATDLRGASVLDAGCGTGFFVRWYAERGASVHGLDISDVSVTRLRAEYPTQRFDVADIASRAFALPGVFDVVNIWDVLYHIVDDDAFAVALGNLARSVTTDGRLILTDQLAGSGSVSAASHVRFRCLASYQAHLPALGLQLVQLLPLYFLLNDDRSGRPQSDELAASYFEFDSRAGIIARDNLAVGVWRRVAEPFAAATGHPA
jgi:SAM-dependent methyltransferase